MTDGTRSKRQNKRANKRLFLFTSGEAKWGQSKLVSRVTWPHLHLKSQQKPLETSRERLSILERLLLLGYCNTQAGVRDTGKAHKHLQLTASVASQHRHTANTVPRRLMAHTLAHDNALIFIFPPPLSPSSAECIGRALGRNPLSRHFSFPLTDRLWRARAFGPPAWLAARQLNKPSSCYNSLKHFQLPESNKSCRRALRCFSRSNPTPHRVLPGLSLGFSWRPPPPPLRWRGSRRPFLDKKLEVGEGNWRVRAAEHREEGDA